MDLQDQVEALPLVPGVYLFKDSRGQVIYVGKANNLRVRVRQYLGGHDERYMVRYLVAAAASVDVVPVSSEREALLMESTLIKQHHPRYNTKWRDDKNFLHLRLDPAGEWPRFTLVRRVRDDGARYFGPYHSATTARRTLSFLSRNFALRTCTDKALAARRRPCVLFQLHRCSAPCVGKVSKEDYSAIAADALLFLSGKNKELLRRTSERMTSFAEEERFEEAARLRDLLRMLEGALDRQSVVDTRLGDRDVWGLYREGDRGVVVCLPVREGLARDPQLFPFDGEIGEAGEILSSLLNAVYDQVPVPPEILASSLPDAAEALAELLGERRGSKVELRIPQRGEKVRVLQIAEESAKAHFLLNNSEEERITRALEGIAEIVGLPAPPTRIECYDNSNLLGEDPVASQVVFIDGRPDRGEYRRYKVKTVVGADDYATMREILGRRMKRALAEGDFPDLLVVDGGRGQLSAAEDVLAELGLNDQPVIGISKPRTERRRGEWDAVDKLILRGQPEPVVLRHDHPSLRLLQHIRDEAHREAVGFHRKQRSKSKLHSALDDVPGIGPTRRKALLTHFGSMTGLKKATTAQIAEVPGIGTALAEIIAEKLAAS
jgi:excinuclease ABC subunit C